MRGRGTAVEEAELRAAKRGYREALTEGNREEEARWANVVGDLFKRRGEYVEALKWLRIDYDISSKHLPARHLLPTCQSLGELLLRLDRFNDALVFQKKHLELAKDSDNLIEQQRATTQLGRTYHEIFLRSEHDHCAIRNAKKYFKSAMKLVRKLRENATGEKSSFFLKEYIDAHNNIGMLDIDLDNLEEAEKILLKGLKICDEEEVVEDDDGRSRLHHNLGRLYVELREWGKARVHIEKDILICKRIGHPQGEAKGFINFGELQYKVQEYDEAIRCYQKALSIVKCLEDEDALVDQINQNMEIVKEARNVLEELKKDEQKLKKLMRTTCDARGTSNERKCLSDQLKCLDSLIEKCRSIFTWPRHREFAKRKKRVASELCDKEKLGDSYLCIGESYQKLRNFSKARKWYMKGWNVYRSIGNLEGQALTKINIGEVLDSSGDWDGALQAFENGYRLAVEANRRFVQLSALENMHYSHMIRFDNIKEARKLQNEIQNLKFLLKEEGTSKSFETDYCSETETDGDDLSESASSAEKIDDDAPLASLVCPRKKNPAKSKKLSQLDSHGTKSNIPCNLAKEVSYKDLSKTQQSIGRKRVRVVISDDEAEELDEVDQLRRVHTSHVEDVATSDKDSRQDEQSGINEVQDATHPNDSKDVLSSCTPIHVEESTYFKSKSPQFTADNGMEFIASGSKLDNVHVSGSPLHHGAGFNAEDENAQSITCKIGNDVVFVDLHSCMYGDYLDVESVKVEVACMYYLQLSEKKKSRGLLPLIGHLKYCGKALGSLEAIDDLKHFVCGKVWIEVVIDGWVQKRLMKLYIDYCKKLSEAPYMKLLKKLYNLEVSEDEVIASDCGLQDISISPFLNALQAHKAVAILDISHNLLGNETVEKLQQIFTSSSQKYGGLTLDLHCNRFGPTSLFQICESPIMLARLEVLDLSENRLTDASSSYLSTILENCKALYSLNMEQCSITSRTIQKVAEALHDGSVLSRLFIGKNNPISGNAMASLLSKLTSMKRFSELSLCGIRFNKPVLDHLCQLARTSNLSALLLGGTCIGVDGAARLTEALLSGPQELVKLDLSYCGLTSHDFTRTLTNITLLGGILELNLGGNSISQEGCDALRSVLVDPECSLKCVILNKCHLGLAGILQIVQALSGNISLEELHLTENADILQERTLQYNATTSGGLATACEKSNGTDTGNNVCAMNAECNNLEVADSDDEMLKGLAVSGPDGSCASSSMRSTYLGSQLIQELCEAIGLANHVQLLNLSKNGLSPEVVEALYSSWSSSSRSGGLARKHVAKDQTVHFWVDGRRCCGMKPCCRRD